MTTRQANAIKILSYNVYKPLGVIMREAGYSLQTSRNPLKLTSSKAFIEHFGKSSIDEMLAKTLRDTLEAKKYNPITRKLEPDHLTRLKSVNIVFKLKGIL